jgi:Ca2+-binding EF-hand superfamily protein
MQARNRNLIALALTAALASPLAFAQQGKGNANTNATVGAGQPTAESVKTGERPASPTLPTQSNPKATDAITERSTRQDAMDDDDTADATATTTTTTTADAGATEMDDSTKASAKSTNPGKGNWWADADADGDGKLSTTEAAANAGLNSRFTTIDGDKDGFVTQDEYRTFFTANASQGAANAAPHSAVVSRELWTQLDADTDSKLSLAEVAANAELTTSFASIDANADGFVTQDEYTAYAKANMSKK